MEIKFVKGLEWDHDKTLDMIQFEKETNKNSIYRGKITGQFEYWMYCSKRSKSKKIIQKIKVQKPKLRVTTNENVKVIKSRITIHVPPKSTCYEKKRRGTQSHPEIETYSLNNVIFKYNWTEGQLYVDNKLICPPDTKYGRDMLTYARQNKPHISIDKLRKWWISNYDMANNNNWDECATSIKQYLKAFGLTVEI